MDSLYKEYSYLIEGQYVWYRNLGGNDINPAEPPYSLGVISDLYLDNQNLTVVDGPSNVKFEDTLPYVYNEEINENELTNLWEASEIDILNNLKNRLVSSHMTFTNFGPILLIVNPYKRDDDVYSKSKIDSMITIKPNDSQSDKIENNDPHLYKIIDNAVHHLMENNKNQAIVFSGESGAGKTVAIKYSLECLIYCFNKDNQSEEFQLLHNKIQSSIIILEAFGNAKTIQNDTSTRFAKVLSLYIDTETGNMDGMMIDTLLLDKSRISEISEGERNFNFFYQLLACGNIDLLSSLYLTSDVSQYEILVKSDCYKIDGLNDKEAFKETVACLETIEFSWDEIDMIYRIIASVLLLGNLSFIQESTKEVFVSNKDVLEHICEILQCKDEDIEKAFTVNINKVSGVEYYKPVKDISEAKTLCNIFAQELYNRLFEWINLRINNSLDPNDFNKTNPNKKIIQLFDIFGFEHCKTNSLEQLLINYTNEIIHQYYTKYYYATEIEEFKREKLNELADSITYQDNQTIIDIFEADSKSLIPLINESTFNRKTHIQFFENLQKIIGKTNKLIQFPRNVAKGSFQISHFARPIIYNSTLIIVKNKDEIKNSMIEIIEKSRNILLKQIFLINYYPKEQIQAELEEMKKIDYQKKNNKFLCTKYLESLAKILSKLKEYESHYIRCLNPNPNQEPYYVHQNHLLNQIKFFGISDAIKKRTDGYPCRLPYIDFYKHFELIFPDFSKINLSKNVDYKALSMRIIGDLTSETAKCPHNQPSYYFGDSKIFLKSHFFNILEINMEEKLKDKITALQKIKVGIIHMIKRHKLYTHRLNTKAIQIFYKTSVARSTRTNIVRKINLIQSTFLTKRIEKNYNNLNSRFNILQSFLKSRATNNIMERKMEMIKMLSYRFHVYIKQIAQKRQRKMRRIAEMFFNNAIEVIRVGEYYNLWKKVCPFFVCYLVKKKYARITRKAKLVREHRKKVCIIQTFHSNNLLSKIKQKQESTKIIRSFVVSNILSNYYDNLRNNILLIQEYAKLYYMKKRTIMNQIESYFLEDKEIGNNVIQTYEKSLFPYLNSIQSSNIYKANYDLIYQSSSSNERMVSNISANNNKRTYVNREQNNKEINSNAILPEISMYNEGKVKLFSKILDMDIMADLSEIYDNSWTDEYQGVNKLNMDKKTPIQMIYSSENHTMVLNSKGKIYSWGWNDYGQCGGNTKETIKSGILPSFKSDYNVKFPILPLVNYQSSNIHINDIFKEIEPITHIACGDCYSFILNEKGNVFCLGKNNKGQLGFGDCLISNEPRLLSSFEGEVKDIKTTENMTAVLTKSNEVFAWYSIKEDEPNLPYQLFADPKIKIIQLACGCNFLILLTHNGIVYGMGSNSRGELGLPGDIMREFPEEIVRLSAFKEKIISIKCGYKHTLCLSSSGKVYSWGVNSDGQLGKEDQKTNNLPQLVQINLKQGNISIKTLHIAAGFRSSFFLMENRSIYYCGIIGNNNPIFKPIQFRIDIKSPEVSSESEFCPIRILTSWNKSFSLFYATFADLRQLTNILPYQKINTIFKTLASKWTNERIFCPYNQTIAPYFNPSFMKKSDKN